MAGSLAQHDDVELGGARPRLSRLALIVSLAASAALCWTPVANPDLPWHLSAGRWLALNGHVPRADFLSWTQAGTRWIDFEWLPQLAFWAAHRAGGMTGIWILKSAAFGLLLTCWAALLRRWRVGLDVIAGLLPLSAASLIAFFDARPEIVSFFCVLVQLALLEDVRAGRRVNGGLLLAQAALYCLWANSHGAFPLGFALCAFYAFERGSVGGAARRLLLAAVAGTVVTPWGPWLYEIFVRHALDMAVMREHINEWRVPELENLYQRPFWLIHASAWAVGLSALWQGRSIPRAHLLTLLVVGWFSASSYRMTCYATLILLPIALLTAKELATPAWWPKARPWAAGACAALALLLAYPVLAFERWGHETLNPRAASPAAASSFLARQRDALGGLRLYNPWNWGGHLGWALGPHYKVFVDGRYLFAPMLRELHAARRDPMAWRDFASRYPFQLALIESSRPLYRYASATGTVWRPFEWFAFPAESWALIYWDEEALVLVKRDAVDAGWLARHEFSVVKPDDLQTVARALATGALDIRAARREVERYARDIPAPREAARLKAWLEEVERERGGRSGAGRAVPNASIPRKPSPGSRGL